MRLTLCALMILMSFAVFADEELSARLRFPPTTLVTQGDDAAIERVTIVSTDNAVARYAAEWLAAEMKILLNVDAQTTAEIPQAAAGDVVLIIHDPTDPQATRHAPGAAQQLAGPDSYALRRISRNNGRLLVVVGADGPGALYGTQSLADILRCTGGRIPQRLEAADAPEMTIRGKTAGIHEFSPYQLQRLDWFARWRLNTAYYEVMGDQGQKDIPDYMPKLARECARRGIVLYGAVSQHRSGQYLKASPCPCNAQHVAYIDHLLEGLAAGGVGGIMLNCDDIPPEDTEHAKRCPQCAKRFGDLADLQIFWLGRVVAIGRKHGITRYVVGPTPYLADMTSHVPSGFDTLAYFKKLGRFCADNGISIYHCALREKTLRPVLDAGVTTYAWWYNGVYDLSTVTRESGVRLPGGYYGLAKLKWGWGTTDWIHGTGLRMRDDAVAALRALPRLTKEAWLCGSDQAQWGMYVWRPSRVEPDRLFRLTIEDLLGPGSFEPYMTWEKTVQACLPMRGFKVTPSLGDEPSEAHVATLEADARHAAEAVAVLRSLRGPSIAPPRKNATERQTMLSRMETEAKKISALARALKTGDIKVSKGGEVAIPRRGVTKLVRDMEISGPRVVYKLRSCSYKQPDGSYRRGSGHKGSDLGMTAPSPRNWYDAGFIDVELDGQSLERTHAEWSKARLSDGRNALRGLWKTPWGDVTLTLTIARDKSLEVHGRLGDNVKAKRMVVRLWALPATGSEPDMAKRLTTALRTEQPSQKVALDTTRENVVVLYDRNYDVPRKGAFGPCAVRFEPGAPAGAEVHLSSYIVTAKLDYGGARVFRLFLHDYAGCTNGEVLDFYRRHVFAVADR